MFVIIFKSVLLSLLLTVAATIILRNFGKLTRWWRENT